MAGYGRVDSAPKLFPYQERGADHILKSVRPSRYADEGIPAYALHMTDVRYAQEVPHVDAREKGYFTCGSKVFSFSGAAFSLVKRKSGTKKMVSNALPKAQQRFGSATA